VLDQSEDGSNKTDNDASVHQRLTANAAQASKSHLRQVWNMDVRLTGERAGDETKHGHEQTGQEA
ncbi:MAG: hypothetical protein ACXWBP_00145, partial [Limisphaerales bacterium]